MNEHLYDHLKDIAKNILGVGVIELIRVEGTTTATTLNAIDEQKLVIVSAVTKAPIPEFVGVFGMPNLTKLDTILGLSEYRENAKFTVTKSSDGALNGLHFENAAGDFKNDYRFMSQQLVNSKLQQVMFKGAKWIIDLVPTPAAIQRLNLQIQANAGEATCQFNVVNKDLICYFGDPASHTGNFVFANNITGTFKQQWDWPVAIIKNIMALTGTKAIKFSDEGVILVTVDSGLINYSFYILAIIK